MGVVGLSVKDTLHIAMGSTESFTCGDISRLESELTKSPDGSLSRASGIFSRSGSKRKKLRSRATDGRELFEVMFGFDNHSNVHYTGDRGSLENFREIRIPNRWSWWHAIG